MRKIHFSLIVATLALSSGLALRAQLPQQVDTWALRGTSPDNRVNAAAVALADGRTLIAGGTIDGVPTDTVVIYDPASGSFSSAGQLLVARTGHTATLLDDGRVLIAGGTINSVLSGDLELFDVVAGTSTLAATMAELRSGHAAARLSDGTVLIAGGTSTAGVLQSAEIFDPSTGTVSMVSSAMQSARTGASATTLIDGRVLIAGGNDGNVDLASAEIFYAAAQDFQPTDTTLSVSRRGHSAVLLPNNGSVLIAGGSSNGEAKASADLFLPTQFPDPYSYGMGRFASTGAMAAPRVGAVGASGLEGFALAIGGGSSDAEAYRFATIKTNKDDYAPGEHAIISGSGWQPGEEVTLLFQEDPAVHDDYLLTTTADAEGRIFYDQWAPEQHDLGVRFYLMATGQQSQRRAQTTFTDGINVTVDDPGSVVWHRTGEVAGGFNVSASGTYTCTPGGGGNSCTSVANVTITVSGAAGSKVVTGLTPANTLWGPVTLEFRTAPGAGQFTIPPDGRPTVTATLNTNATNSPSVGNRNNHFGVDNTSPVTTIQCNSAACANPYNAAVLVTLAASDGPGSSSSGVDSRLYCIDETNTCVPGLSYPNAGFSVAFVAGVTKYVRYHSTDVVGNVETTKSQAIQFQANTFDVTFNATPIADVPAGTTVLSVTIGAGPAVTVTRGELPKTFADLASGTNVSYSYVSPLGVSAAKQYRWLSTSGTGSASAQTTQSGGPFSVTADSTVTTTYKAQHLLTFNLSGVDADYTGAVVTIGGSPILNTSFVSNSYTQWIDDGDAAPSVSWTDPLASSVTGKRYDFLNATPASFTSPVTTAQTMTASYQKQWLLTFNLSGVDGDYTGTVVTIGGSPILNTSFVSNSYTQWINDGTTAPGVSWTDPLPSSVTGKRYDFLNATPGTLTSPVTAPQTMTANYQKQWLLTFNLSGVDGDYTGTVVTIGGSPIAHSSFISNSYTEWVNDGSTPTVVWQDPLASTVTNKRYDFLNTTPASLTTPIAAAQTLTANYQKQWLLTFTLSGVDADYTGTVVTIGGSPIASTSFVSNSYTQWVNDGSLPTVAWKDPLASTVTGKQYAFLNATPLTTPVTAPQTTTATYQKQWLLTWTQTGLAGTGTHAVVTVNLSATALGSPRSEWFNDGASVSYAFHTPISTDPASSTQFELTNGGTLPSSPITVSSAMTIEGVYSPNTYTIQYLSPLDQSEGTDYHVNSGKNGRVIPVKVLLFKNGVAISDTSTVIMRVVGSNCSAGSGTDPIEEYADAGASSGGTNLFRWSAPHWIYNLDTRAVGMATNSCYRLDVYIGSITGPTAIKASALRWAIFKPVK